MREHSLGLHRAVSNAGDAEAERPLKLLSIECAMKDKKFASWDPQNKTEKTRVGARTEQVGCCLIQVSSRHPTWSPNPPIRSDP